MNVHANILFLVHNGAPFGKWWSQQSQPTEKWAPFILREIAFHEKAGRIQVDSFVFSLDKGFSPAESPLSPFFHPHSR